MVIQFTLFFQQKMDRSLLLKFWLLSPKMFQSPSRILQMQYVFTPHLKTYTTKLHYRTLFTFIFFSIYKLGTKLLSLIKCFENPLQ